VVRGLAIAGRLRTDGLAPEFFFLLLLLGQLALALFLRVVGLCQLRSCLR
jgi:hypothetical protein